MKSSHPIDTGTGDGSDRLDPSSMSDGKVAMPSRPPRKARSSVAARPGDGANGSGPREALNGVDGNMSAPSLAGLPIAQPSVHTPDEVARSYRARRRLSLLAGLVLLLAVLAVEVAALSPWTETTAGLPPRQVSVVPLAEVQPYGVNTFLHKEVDRWKREKTLDMARDMGAVWIKQQFPWAEIEFAKDHYWDDKNNQSSWQKFDDIVDLAAQRGLRIIARIDSTPDWARFDDDMPEATRDYLRSKPKAPPSKSHIVDFGQFMQKFVERYKGRVAAIQIWNEPNLVGEWQTGVNATEYVTLLQRAYIAAKSADPNIIVLAAPLATNNETLDLRGNLNEIDYLQAMYFAGAKSYFDAMSANAYGKDYPPEDPPSRQKLNFRRVELLRQVMEKSGDGNKAVWFNEYGWNASPDSIPANKLNWGRVTPEQQADYTVRGIQYAREHWSWAGAFTIWYLRQVGDIPPTESEYYFSLVNPEFVPGTAYREIRDATHEQDKVAAPGEWGPLAPPVDAGSGWNIGLDEAVRGGAYLFPSASANGSLEMTFQGTDLKVQLVPIRNSDTLTSTNMSISRYYVTVDGSSDQVASSLPRVANGRAYIDALTGDQVSEVQVVQGLWNELQTGQHRLSITAARIETGTRSELGSAGVAAPIAQEQANLPGIGVITVEARRSYLLFTMLTLLLVAGIALEVYALWRTRAPVANAGERGASGR